MADDFFSQAQSSEEEYMNRVEQEINDAAKQRAVDFIQSHPQFSGSFDQVFLVYKFCSTPQDHLNRGLMLKPRDLAKKYFKQVVVLLHPDKNHHPLAKEAFQKLKSAFEQV